MRTRGSTIATAFTILSALLLLLAVPSGQADLTGGTSVVDLEPHVIGITMMNRNTIVNVSVTIANTQNVFGWQVALFYNYTGDESVTFVNASMPADGIFEGKEYLRIGTHISQNISVVETMYSLLGANQSSFYGSGKLADFSFNLTGAVGERAYFWLYLSRTKFSTLSVQPIAYNYDTDEAIGAEAGGMSPLVLVAAGGVVTVAVVAVGVAYTLHGKRRKGGKSYR